MKTITIPVSALNYVLCEKDKGAVLWELMDWDSPTHVHARWFAYEEARNAAPDAERKG